MMFDKIAVVPAQTEWSPSSDLSFDEEICCGI